MSLRKIFPLLFLVAWIATNGCATETQTPTPVSEMSPSDPRAVLNPYPADIGDVEAAYARAVERLKPVRPPGKDKNRHDAGTPPPPPIEDAGSPPPTTEDAGTPPPPPVEDAGTPPPVEDAGTPPPIEDAGTPPPPPPPPPPATTTALVLYDRTNAWGWLGELYAMNVGALAGQFGSWSAKPVAEYVAGDIAKYTATIYVGSTYDEQLPVAFLDDVLADTRPVIWMRDNIWQLFARSPSFATDYGFAPWTYDMRDVSRVDYKGISLTRYLPNASGIMTYSSMTTAAVLAEAVWPDGTKIPWAVRGKKLTYIGENPLTYVTSNDRYLVWADLMFDALAPNTPERHRALVRIEDVSPMSDPAELVAIADYLANQNVPFAVALSPRYVDPRGYYNNGVPEALALRDAPAVVDALRTMTTKGGTLVLHGYTHQFGTKNNPYSGVTGDDFEFYTAHVDSANYVIYDGPVPGDSKEWAASRIASGLAELAAVNLPAPVIFEYPHYAGSAADSLAVRDSFATVYHRGYYFGGLLSGTAPNYSHPIGVMYPYVGRDVFGLKVLPENLGNYEPEWSNNNPPRLVSDLLYTANVNKVVRDGFASFYFHPYNKLSVLQQLVTGVKAQGYTFVSVTSL